MKSAMKKQKLSKDTLVISQHGTKSSNSVTEYSELIPVDILIDIFSRVSAKSIARFRCVSKFWSSILQSLDFTDTFFTMSSTRPRLLFTIRVDNELFLFSSPRPQNLDENSSLVATRYKYSQTYFQVDLFPPLCGLFCLQNSVGIARKAQLIFNPITGESITLPEVKAEGFGRSFFGYDPINKQFKVLFVTWSEYKINHSVLRFEYGKRCLWRKIRNPRFPYRPRFGEICINGVLYYKADSRGCPIIVCFKHRTEKLSVVNVYKDMWLGQLFNYNGKLGVFNMRETELVIWVLEDRTISKWSKTRCVLPDEIRYTRNNFVGMTSTGEIVFSPTYLAKPFYVWFYNIERKTITRVDIQGFDEFMDRLISKYSLINFTSSSVHVHTFIDYVENVRMQLGSTY